MINIFMWDFIKKIFVFENKINSLSFEEIQILGRPRSSKWKKIREEHLKKQPFCMICGNTKDLVPHHILPFHTDPEKELDPENLITLCEGSFNCHLFFGHLKNWTKYNPNIVEDAKIWREKIGFKPT